MVIYGTLAYQFNVIIYTETYKEWSVKIPLLTNIDQDQDEADAKSSVHNTLAASFTTMNVDGI